MKYNLDRFTSRNKKTGPDNEVASDVVRMSTWPDRLGRVLNALDKKNQVHDQAKESMALLVARAKSVGSGEENVDVAGRLMTRLLKFVGKKAMKALVRPVLRFAAQVARSVVRIAARVALRFLIWPAIELVGAGLAAALATPVGWAVLGTAAVVGGTYLLLKNRSPEIIEIEDTLPTGAVVGEAAPEYSPRDSLSEVGEVDAVPGAIEVPRSRLEQVMDSVRSTAPVQAIERAVERPKVFVPKKGSKFKGFGAEVDTYIKEASARYPILQEDVLRGFIKMEAGWTGNMSPTGAIGTGQFTAGTWNRLISRGGAAIGMTPITGIYREEKDAKGRTLRPSIKSNPNGNFRTPEDPRFNKRVNTLATGLLAAGNAQMLKNAGIPITGANLYMMHNIGPGIIAVMKGGKATAATLKAMQQNGMVGPINTADKFLAYQKGRFEDAYSDANTSTALAHDDPKMQSGVVVDAPKRPSQIAAQGGTQRPGAALSNKQTGDLVKGPNNTIVRM